MKRSHFVLGKLYDIIKASYKIGVENDRCRKCPVLKCCQKVADVELKVNQKLFGYFCMKSVDPFNQHQPFWCQNGRST